MIHGERYVRGHYLSRMSDGTFCDGRIVLTQVRQNGTVREQLGVLIGFEAVPRLFIEVTLPDLALRL